MEDSEAAGGLGAEGTDTDSWWRSQVNPVHLAHHSLSSPCERQTLLWSQWGV